VMPDMKDYLDFVLKLFFAFGIAFEVPIATILLCWMGTTTPDSLREKRAYVIVGAFVIGMLLTPPDMISQTLLAIPMWLLFEAGILFAPFFMPKEDDDNGDDDPDSGKAARAPQAAPVISPSDKSSTEESTKKPFDPTEFKSDYLAPTDTEMEAELDRIEAEEDQAESSDTSSTELDAAESSNEEPLDEAAQAREDRARKQAQREADNIRMDHYESPISERYGELDAESERALDEELELMDGGDYDDDAEEFDEESEKDPSEQK